MQPVEEPPLHAGETVFAGDHPAQRRIDVDPRLQGIAELDAQHRQRRLPRARGTARIVVGVVVGQQRGFDDRRAGNRRRQPRQQRLHAERLVAHRQRVGRDEQRPGHDVAHDTVRPPRRRLHGPLHVDLPGPEAQGIIRIVLDAQQLDLLHRTPFGDASPRPGIRRREARQLHRSAGQRIARDVEAADAGPGVGLHRQQTAEHPGQRREPEDDAGQVVPAHPAGVGDTRPHPRGRPLRAARPAPPELRDAEHQPDDREQAAQGRRPDHDVVPERLVRAQRREVDPVRNRTDPRQRPAPPRGQHHHLGGAGRDVELGAGIVVDQQLAQRQPPPFDQRPLIGLGERAGVLDGSGRPAGEPARDGGGSGRSHLAEPLAGVGEHGHAVEPVGRPVHHRQQRRAPRGR